MDLKRPYDAGYDDGDDEGQLCHQPKRQKVFPVSQYRLAWICALPLEMTAARMMLDEIHDEMTRPLHDTNTYVLGAIGHQNIVIACLPAMQYGTVKAAAVVTNLMRTFPQIRLALMVGIAGAAPSHANDIRLGDVVVGTRVMSYDLSKAVDDGIKRTEPPKQLRTEAGTLVSSVRSRHDIDRDHNFLSIVKMRSRDYREYRHPDLPDRLFQPWYSHVIPDDASEASHQASENETRSRASSEHMSSTTHTVTNSPEPITMYAQATDCHTCDDSQIVRRVLRNSKAPKVHYGAIASGNQLIKTAIARDRYAKELGVVCFEMEAAGLMDLVPCIPIRGMSDYSDTHKNKSWQKYASLTAASFARDMIEHLPVDNIVDAATIPSHRTMAVDPASSSSAKSTTLQRRQALLESLNFDQIRKFDIKAAHAKTCHWFLRLPEYQQWLDYTENVTHHGFLWLRGKPGVGKSTIMKFLYGRMRKKDQHGLFLTIAFFFHARGALLERSILGMYRSLLFQILSAFPDLQAVFDDSDIVPKTQTDCPSLCMLKNMLQQAVLRLGRRCVTCYIDALDECDEQQVVEMVQFFEDLAETSIQQDIRLRVCFSSRHYPYIDIPAGLGLVLEDLEGHAGDLSEYILTNLRVKDRALLAELQSQLLEKSSSVFLWIVLVVDILNKENRRGRLALRKRLSEIPSGLTDLFRDLIKRDSQNMQDFRLCVMWILSAARPLSPGEYYHAIWSGLAMEDLVDMEPPEVCAEDSEDCIKRCVISSSKGLAEIAKGKHAVVQFIHESVRDFLIKDGGLYELWSDLGMDWESSSHELLKRCCSFYVNYATSGDRGGGVTGSKCRTQEELPLLRYAAQTVLYHADGAAIAYPQDDFLATFLLRDWIEVHNDTEKVKARQYRNGTNLLYILADRGYSRLIRRWLQTNPKIVALGDDCRTSSKYRHPFFAALASGQKETISAILGSESSAVYDCDVAYLLTTRTAFEHDMFKGRTSPLTWAAWQGLTGLVRWILENGVSPDTPDNEKHTALFMAIRGDKLEIVKLLLNHGANVNRRDRRYDEPPLVMAARYGYVQIVRALLENGADVNCACKRGMTALLDSARNGLVELSSTLLEYGADVNYAGERGMTALLHAANKGHVELSSTLLEYKADMKHADTDGRTSLILATKQGHVQLVKTLLEKNAKVNQTDKYGRAPLSYAASSSNLLLAQLLIQKGAHVNIKDKSGLTPWEHALRRNRFSMAEALAQHGADVHLDVFDGYSLLKALRDNDFDLAESLIERGATLNVDDLAGLTPLGHACRMGKLRLCELLLRKGALPDLSGGGKDTPLMHTTQQLARLCGREPTPFLEMVILLIENGADINQRDTHGKRTPLHYACQGNHFELAKLLIDKGCLVNEFDHHRSTPLMEACAGVHQNLALISFLIEKGASIDKRDMLGRKAIDIAYEDGKKEIVAILTGSGRTE